MILCIRRCKQKYIKISELSGFYRLDDIYLSLIDQYMFPCLILNDRGEIVASSESADQYLKSSKGNIHQAFPASLSVQVNAALQRAKKEKKCRLKTFRFI